MKVKFHTFFSVIFLFFNFLFMLGSSFAGPSHGPGEWQEMSSLQEERRNPFNDTEDELKKRIHNGRYFAVNYPIEVTGSTYPQGMIDKAISSATYERPNFLLGILRGSLSFLNITSMDSLGKYLGLNRFPENQIEFPRSENFKEGDRLAIARFKRNGKEVFTLSCLACHSSTLFGKVIMGLSNRYPQANEVFSNFHKIAKITPPSLVQMVTHVDDADLEIYKRAIQNSYSIAAIKPTAPGLEIPLAQVALSLDRRKLNPWSEKSTYFEKNPRENIINSLVTDTKPAVWWNVRYKTRWLLDGSIVSGNPLMSVVLMNEIGRGTDMYELSDWIQSHPEMVKDLAAAVLNTEAPRITEFFKAERISIENAKHGERLFNKNCSHCHGKYEKNWSLPEFAQKPLFEQIKTHSVNYHWGKGTPVIDVGTDPDRYLAIKGLEPSYNQLEISKRYDLKLETQKGYVPPPLVGIWARWPYFHNNSAPNLCAVLTLAAKRPKKFYMGPAQIQEIDFDFDCVGYPIGRKTPEQWTWNSKMLFDTTEKGLSNAGHEKMLLNKFGNERYSTEDKKDIIEFLKTL